MLYDCKVRLSGSVLNEVPRTNVSAAEIFVLRGIHGEDAVVDITDAKIRQKEETARAKETGWAPKHPEARRQSAEREYLEFVYGEKIINELFGASFRSLPTKLAEVEDDEAPVAPVPTAAKGKAARDNLDLMT